jgi:hypothetical protein
MFALLKGLRTPSTWKVLGLKGFGLKEMLDNYGSCAKIAYYNGKPAAQILYYPEVADKAKVFKREGVPLINCIYNPTTEAQRFGLGRMLLQSVVQDVKNRKSCLGNKPIHTFFMDLENFKAEIRQAAQGTL